MNNNIKLMEWNANFEEAFDLQSKQTNKNKIKSKNIYIIYIVDIVYIYIYIYTYTINIYDICTDI